MELKDRKALKDQQEQMEHKDHKVTLERKAHKE